MPNFPKNENFLPPHTHAYDEMEHWFEMGQRKTLEMNIPKQIIRTQVSTIIQKKKKNRNKKNILSAQK